MSEYKFLDLNGLVHYHGKLKKIFASKSVEDSINTINNTLISLQTQINTIDNKTYTWSNIQNKPIIEAQNNGAIIFNATNNIASGSYSSAFGYKTQALSSCSFAEGSETIASHMAHAEGYQTQANGSQSHAGGQGSITTGQGSFAHGKNCEANGVYSFATNGATIANGDYSFASGADVIANGRISHAEGERTRTEGQCAHAEGKATWARGDYSHAEGFFTIALGKHSHAEGHSWKGESDFNHFDTLAGSASELISMWNTSANFNAAVGEDSHSEGVCCLAAGRASHAQGFQSGAFGQYSFATGLGLRANHDNQTVVGKYNSDSDALFIVGMGESNSKRCNAFQVNKNGTLTISDGSTDISITPAQLQALLDLIPVNTGEKETES